MHGIAHFIDSPLTGMNGASHGLQFIGVLDRARMFGQHLAFQHINIIGDQGRISGIFDLVDCKTPVAASMVFISPMISSTKCATAAAVLSPVSK